MPFTFSHPAVVVPVARKFRWLHFPSLVIGSMVPDFGYFFPWGDFFQESAHTFVRSFTFCLPLGMMVLGLFYLFRAPFVKLLVEPHRSAVQTAIHTSPFNVNALIAISLLIGSWSHIIWDSFTHRTGYFVNKVPFLSIPLFEKYYVFNLLQHLSSIAGLLFLWIIYRRWVSFFKKPARNIKVLWWWVGMAVVAAILTTVSGVGLPSEMNAWELRVFFFKLVTTFIRMFLIELLLVLTFVRFQHH